ncbi:MAG: co-chaperone DjlA [Steroidobacteraceae bacterium]
MSWKGKFFGAVIGLMATRTVWGAVLGAVIGHMADDSGILGGRPGAWRSAGGAPAGSPSISDEFFRTAFEIMGHVAKSDGRVSEAEIDAARQLMHELNLGTHDTSVAIERFRAGKAAAYDASSSIERLREACGQRYDLLRAFMELQLRAALAGNGMSPPARAILTRVAERLGMSGLEFAYMEAALRARQAHRAAAAPRAADSLAECYAELEIDSNLTDQEVTKAYRRQMSRHHPDKLVANGLPESMAQMAKEKTQRIQEAYEGIRAARGMR